MRNRHFLLNKDTYHFAFHPPPSKKKIFVIENIINCLGWNQDGDCSAETRLEGSHISDQELEFTDI